VRGNVAKIKVNSNFHHVIGENLFVKQDHRFQEYRRQWKEWPEMFYVGPFPLFLDVEVTSACNLKCEFCATTHRGDKIRKGFITFEMVKKIIDEGADNGLCGVKFNIRGEPLMHPQICDFVRYAKDKGLIDVYFNTNAVLLEDSVARGLIEAGLDRISISFEGIDKKMYERYRKGSDYNLVIENIENLKVLRNKMGVRHPKIRIQTVMLPEIAEIFEEYKSFWMKKADEVCFLDYKEMKDRKEGIKYPWACPQIWQRMAIWWDGTILPCNHDDDGLLALGNVSEINIESCWHSQKLNEIRNLHKNSEAHLISACDGCYLRDSEINKCLKKEKNDNSDPGR